MRLTPREQHRYTSPMKPEHVRIAASLRLAEAAQMIHVHPETLRRWADDGKVPYVRTPGGQRRFSPDDLAALMGGPAKR